MRKNTQFLGANFAYLRHSFSWFCMSMQRLQIKNIEFYAASPHLYVSEATYNDVKKIKDQLKQAGIQVCCFTAEQCNYPISLASSDRDVWNRSLRYYEKSLEYAVELGSPLMQMISGISMLEEPVEESLKRSVEGIAHIAAMAEKRGIRIVLEADPNCTVDNTDTQLSVIRKIHSPALTGMIDTNAVALNREDFEDVVQKLGTHLHHVHFIDIDEEHGRFCLVPGEGRLPMKQYLKILDIYGYQGGLTPEFWGTTYHLDAEGSMERAMRFMISD